MTMVGQGAEVHLGLSKTRGPSSRGFNVFIPAVDAMPSLCPIRAIATMAAATPSLPGGPLFVSGYNGVRSVLIYKDLRSVLARWARALGVNPALFGTHSARIGCASLAKLSGADDIGVMRLGDWVSNGFTDYCRYNFTQLRDIQRAMMNFMASESLED